MSDPEFLELAERILDLVGRPIDWEKYAAEQAARTDPWRWVCRLCSEKGEAPDRDDRDFAARDHLGTTRCGRFAVTGWAETGRLLHVWSYPASALAELN